ncbi:MAG: hypothetical protein ACYSU7_14750 [Planctomycetota bacterium]|jgi:hypothetical protein
MRLPIALITVLSALSLVHCGEGGSAERADGPAAAGPPAPTMPGQTTTAPAQRPSPPDWKPSDDPRLAKFMGLEAPKPATWIEHPPSGLGRKANYTVPGRDGNEAAHVVVYYFGQGQGGDIESNIERWQYQFRTAPDATPQEPIVEKIEVSGMPVTIVELAGAWMKMGQSWYTEDQLFIAAIVQVPEGSVFIRFSGQTATVEANRAAFSQMIDGLRRSQPATS